MKRKFAILMSVILVTSILASCSLFEEPPELSGVPPVSVDVAPEALSADTDFLYESAADLAAAYNQMNSLRVSVCNLMFSAVVTFSDDSAWVPVAVNKYALGSDEFLAASFVEKSAPDITAKKILEGDGFTDITISPLDVKDSWGINAVKTENGVLHKYYYTVNYGRESDSMRFTLSIDDVPTLLLSSRRITGGFAVQIWTPEGIYNLLVYDVKEGRFGFIPKTEETPPGFPENDIYFDDTLITSTFASDGAAYTFLLANDILYVRRDGRNYAIPLQ